LIGGLLIDLDGVVYQGDAVVPGSLEALAWIRRESIPSIFLTNTTSRPRAALVEKLRGFGIDVDADDILTPALAAVEWLTVHAPGPIALFVPPSTATEFDELLARHADPDATVRAVVVGDYAERWTFAELNRAFRLLMTEPPPALVALGMTRYWRAPDGLRLDTAPFVMALSHATGVEPVVLGKPGAAFFEAALSKLGVPAAEALMIGDDIRADVDGAQRCGISGLLVKTGKYRPADLESDIRPYAVLDSLAELPAWWRDRNRD